MRDTITILASVIVTMVVAVALGACTSVKTADLPPYPDLTGFDSDAELSGTSIALPESHAVANCVLEKTGNRLLDASPAEIEEAAALKEWALGRTVSLPLDPETATLQQVLDRSRLSMSDVIIYKTCGTVVEQQNGGETRVRARNFTEFHSYDRYRSGTDYSNAGFVEWLSVGSQHFNRNERHGWQEAVAPVTGGMTPTPPSEGFLSFLYEDGVELLSRNEVTEDGVKVYRLGITEKWESSTNTVDGRREVEQTRTSVILIDQETFRFVAIIFETSYEILDETGSQMSEDNDRWLTTHIDHFYDYNQPVFIEVPDEYVPWSDVVAQNLSN